MFFGRRTGRTLALHSRGTQHARRFRDWVHGRVARGSFPAYFPDDAVWEAVDASHGSVSDVKVLRQSGAESILKITFAWYETAGRIVPYCHTAPMSKDDISPLACLLMDDGGQHYLGTLPWIDEGLAKLDAVMSGTVPEATWGREDWGATLRPDEAIVYALHDEGVMEVVLPSTFRRALVAWRDFLQSAPDVAIEQKVEVQAATDNRE